MGLFAEAGGVVAAELSGNPNAEALLVARIDAALARKRHGLFIEGAALLQGVHSFLSRFVAYPCLEAACAHALWIAHTHLMNRWESTPRLAFLSPEPASGKTRALEITELLVPNPVESVNVTAAFLFRRISDGDGPPTLLYDEVDTIFGPRPNENSEQIRGLLNAGHRRGAKVGRCVIRGKAVETEELPAYCAVALAGLGALPDTILSRSIVIRMRRRGMAECIEPFRRRVHGAEGWALRERLASWADQIASSVIGRWPEMPVGVVDRDADCWEPLIAVADAAGGDWPQRARVAAVALVTDGKAATPSLGIRLLADLRVIFGDVPSLTTSTIVERLVSLDESPWADIRGKALDARHLASYLKPYGVQSASLRIGTLVAKGYKRESLHDAWSRYLGEASKAAVTSATAVTSVSGAGDGASA